MISHSLGKFDTEWFDLRQYMVPQMRTTISDVERASNFLESVILHFLDGRKSNIWTTRLEQANRNPRTTRYANLGLPNFPYNCER